MYGVYYSYYSILLLFAKYFHIFANVISVCVILKFCKHFIKSLTITFKFLFQGIHQNSFVAVPVELLWKAELVPDMENQC